MLIHRLDDINHFSERVNRKYSDFYELKAYIANYVNDTISNISVLSKINPSIKEIDWIINRTIWILYLLLSLEQFSEKDKLIIVNSYKKWVDFDIILKDIWIF